MDLESLSVWFIIKCKSIFYNYFKAYLDLKFSIISLNTRFEFVLILMSIVGLTLLFSTLYACQSRCEWNLGVTAAFFVIVPLLTCTTIHFVINSIQDHGSYLEQELIWVFVLAILITGTLLGVGDGMASGKVWFFGRLDLYRKKDEWVVAAMQLYLALFGVCGIIVAIPVFLRYWIVCFRVTTRERTRVVIV